MHRLNHFYPQKLCILQISCSYSIQTLTITYVVPYLSTTGPKHEEVSFSVTVYISSIFRNINYRYL